jgi:hypothetical protein
MPSVDGQERSLQFWRWRLGLQPFRLNEGRWFRSSRQASHQLSCLKEKKQQVSPAGSGGNNPSSIGTREHQICSLFLNSISYGFQGLNKPGIDESLRSNRSSNFIEMEIVVKYIIPIA